MSYLDRFRLDGRVAFVTGGSQGIGLAAAEALADAGATVITGDLQGGDIELDVTRSARVSEVADAHDDIGPLLRDVITYPIQMI